MSAPPSKPCASVYLRAVPAFLGSDDIVRCYEWWAAVLAMPSSASRGGPFGFFSSTGSGMLGASRAHEPEHRAPKIPESCKEAWGRRQS